MWFVFWIMVALSTGVPAAEAQTRTANKQIGGWTVYCRADGMTDRLSCEMFASGIASGARAEGPKPMLLWRDGEDAPGVRLVRDRHSDGAAFLRIGRGAPAAFANCRSRSFVCMASIADDRRLGAEIVAGAESALLRVGSLTSGDDWVFDLSEFEAARAELRRLRVGAGLPPFAARPFDELERETAAAERTRAEIDRQSAAACGREQGRDREFCLATARTCSARGEDVAACVAPFMNRRRYDAHLDNARAACRAKAPGEDARCLHLVQMCFGAEKTIGAFDACFATPPIR